ncbi:MAG: (2Fe-2S)-binding protein [Deltaproteobacteria bacterium]|nr:(2Fe-2S)-binding protein [Deltaproteobacteria bacterium]
MVKIIVDNQEIEAEEGTTVLKACLDNGIYVPNLCFLESMTNPPASCRMCLVEIEGEKGPIPSCTIEVREGMVIRTETAPVRRLQRSALRLLLSVHEVDCAACPANKKCELQRLSKFLKVGLKPKGFELLLKEAKRDDEHPFLDYHPNRCIVCGKCVHVCQTTHGRPFLTFAKRGFNTTISTFGEKDATKIPCPTCMACVEICPVAALTVKTDPQ